PTKDYEIYRNGEVERTESAQRCRWSAAVTDFGELHIGHDVGAAPQAGEEEHGEHSAHQHVPPNPVSGNAVVVDETRHDERCIGSESRRDHRCAGEPPGHLASSEEVLV